MKTLLRLVSTLLAALVLCSCCACAEEYVFTLPGGITWDTTTENTDLFPETALIAKVGHLSAYSGPVYSVAGQDLEIYYFFWDGKLVLLSGGCDADKSVMESAVTELVGLYGEPNHEDFEAMLDKALTISMTDDKENIKQVYMQIPKKAWLLPDGRTLVMLSDMSDYGGLGLMVLDNDAVIDEPLS